MDSPYGSLVASDFTSRGIAGITFSESQVTTYGSPKNTDPYYRLYPSLNIDITGQYSAWAWGVSRVIDGLKLVQNVLPIDLKHIAVTGCSYAGKLALFAGVFDERVALTIAQESGGGGATSWRYSQSEPNGTVEKIDNTDYNWFMNSMNQFSGNNVSRLPEDHHELMAMCAPRALYVTANPDYTWLSNPSCYVCSKACQQIYNTLGIADRFGFSVVGGHMHCQVPSIQIPEIAAFVEKFLLGDTTVNMNIADTPYNTDLSPWITWTTPTLSNGTSFIEWATLLYPSNLQKDLDKSITFKWNKVKDAVKYFIQLSMDPTFANIALGDSTTTDTVKTITGLVEGKRYYWRVQVKNSAGSSGLSSAVWNFTTFVPIPTMPQLVAAIPFPNQLDHVTLKWNQVKYADQYFIQLAHDQEFTAIFYSDSTASDTVKIVTGLSEGLTYYWRVQANNVEGSSPWSDSSFTLVATNVAKDAELPTEYSISQNYPNPFNPTTTFSFGLPVKSYVLLKVFDLLGREVAIIVSEEMSPGFYSRQWNANKCTSGIYFYQLRAGSFVETKKLLFLK
jgi:hypothetical protein